MLGKSKGLRECCPGLLPQVNHRGVWDRTPADLHASQSESRTHCPLPRGKRFPHLPLATGTIQQVLRPAGDSEAPN